MTEKGVFSLKRDLLLLPIYLVPFVYLKLLWESSGYPYGDLMLLSLFAILVFLHKSFLFLLVGHFLSYISSEGFFFVFGLEEIGYFQPFRVWEMTSLTHSFVSPVILMLYFVFRLKKFF